VSAALAEAVDLAGLDLKPSALGDTAPAVCAYPGCLAGLNAKGRGRPPKFCEEHKGGKSTALPGFNTAKSNISGRSWPKAAEIETLLSNHVRMLGAGLALVNEVDGTVIATGGPDVIHELVELAKTDKGLRRYLEWLATPGKYAPLILAIGGVAMPILANHDLMPKLNIKIPAGGEQ